jgi:inorganic pyrophosphatase
MTSYESPPVTSYDRVVRATISHLTLHLLLLVSVAACSPAAQSPAPPATLPATAATQLTKSLADAERHQRHIWRDTAPVNTDGTVNAYVEISRGDLRKWEFAMASNMRAIDRVLPEQVGGYPVNYGFVPQTVSYDGDPFDALVLGPPLAGGELVRGVVIGLMHMEDEKGLDSKVVLSPIGADGRPSHQLDEAERRRIAEYFREYKRWEAGKFSNVPGWGTMDEGRSYVDVTHAFFEQCRRPSASACTVAR